MFGFHRQLWVHLKEILLSLSSMQSVLMTCEK
jgi:hypothetical protein